MSKTFKTYWAWIIVAALCAAYVPYFGTRYIRTGGDEKVYVNQAMEMAQDGRWFVQTINGKPAYYKGPLHYVLVQAGAKVFGRTPWAVLYMNLAFALLGAIALGAIVRRRLPEWDEGPVWTGIGFGLCVGIYAHSFASQMEVELAGTFALALYLLDGLEPEDDGFWFWIVAGFAGWIKAPLHSAFLGVTALAYWLLTGELFLRLKRPRAWLAVFTGIFVGVAGYLPAYFADQKNFVEQFIIKEIYQKTTTWQSVWTPIASTYGFYLFPWLLLAGVAYLQGLWQLPSYLKDRSTRRLLTLIVCFCLPSLLFFIYHPYRFENYNIPSISAVFLLLGLIWSRRTRLFEWLYGIGFAITGLLLIGFAAFVTILYFRFSPMPVWWPNWLLPVIWLGALIAAYVFIRYGLMDKGRRPGHVALAAVAVYWALGGFFSVLGEREMFDIRAYLKNANAQGQTVRLAYFNLMGNIWSEWGLLNFWVDRPVRGIFTPEKLSEAIEQGDTILVPSGEGYEEFTKFVQKAYPDWKFTYTRWKRWKTHGNQDTGQPLWKEGWERRDLTIFERDFMIIKPEGKLPG